MWTGFSALEEEKEGRAASTIRCLEFIIAGTCEVKVDILLSAKVDGVRVM